MYQRTPLHVVCILSYLTLCLALAPYQVRPVRVTRELETRRLVRRVESPYPDGAAIIGGIPAPLCYMKNASDVRSRTQWEPMGLAIVPSVPWTEPGQVVEVNTNASGVTFENIGFYKPVSQITKYITLLETSSNGWRMTMPSIDLNVTTPIYDPEITWTAKANNAVVTGYNVHLQNSWDCHSDKYAPWTSEPPPPPDLPLPNPVIGLPFLSNCSVGATTTTTFTSVMPLRTDDVFFQMYQGEGQGDYWNQTDAVWSFGVANNSDVKFESPTFMQDTRTGSLTFFNFNSQKNGFNFTVPTYFGTPTGPAFGVKATTTSGARAGTYKYNMTIQAEYPCQSDPIKNGQYQGVIPCKTGDKEYFIDTYNWMYREVDLSLSNYWFNGPTATTPDSPAPAAATTKGGKGNLVNELVYHSTGKQVDCKMTGKCFSLADLNPCAPEQNKILPIWSFLALAAIQNLHQQMNTIYNALTVAALEVGDWGLSYVNVFTPDIEKEAQFTESQVALAAAGTVLSVIAAFFPMPNSARVQANFRSLGNMWAKKKPPPAQGGSPRDEPLVAPPPVTPNPKGPASPVDDPQSDPVPPDDTLFAFLDPKSGKGPPEAYLKGLPHAAPLPGTYQLTDKPLVDTIGKIPTPGRAGGAVLLGTIPGTILTGSQTIWAKYDPNSIDKAVQGGNWQAFVANILIDLQASLETWANLILTDPDYTIQLLNYLYGGQYVDGNINMTSLTYLLRTDLTARSINNLWTSYRVYVAFTDLEDAKDEKDTSKCDAHKVGPQITKFCGVGGVFYLYNLCDTDYKMGRWRPPGQQGGLTDQSWASYLGQCTPYGLENFETSVRLNITPSGATEGSARAWNQTGRLNLTVAEDEELTSSMSGLFSSTVISDASRYVGRLAGEWSLPVCDQGKNAWGGDYTAYKEGTSLGHLPCACGYKGNETANFMTAANIQDTNLYELAHYCCEGGPLFPDNKRPDKPAVGLDKRPDYGPGATGLKGGIWEGDLYYGRFTAEMWHNKELYCTNKGSIKIV